MRLLRPITSLAKFKGLSFLRFPTAFGSSSQPSPCIKMPSHKTLIIKKKTGQEDEAGRFILHWIRPRTDNP